MFEASVRFCIESFDHFVGMSIVDGHLRCELVGSDRVCDLFGLIFGEQTHFLVDLGLEQKELTLVLHLCLNGVLILKPPSILSFI